MTSFSTSTWGYKILSDTQISFYHVLLPKLGIDILKDCIPNLVKIQPKKDGSVTISVAPPQKSMEIAEKIVAFFNKKEQRFLETPPIYYKIDNTVRQALIPWALALEGCLAVMLSKILDMQWELIDSQAGGIALDGFTLLLNKDYPKIIHPISVSNYNQRLEIEKLTAKLVSNLAKNVAQAQPGMEGLALLAFSAEKTKLPEEEIVSLIEQKSYALKNPTNAPIFAV